MTSINWKGLKQEQVVPVEEGGESNMK